MRRGQPKNNVCCRGRVSIRKLMKIKNRKIIKGYRPKFSVQKKLTFSGQQKIANTMEKIANNFVKAFKNFKPF